MDQSDDLTFRVIFSADGVSKLRDRVKDKLKEFMGDYTDDTLVEYVIVLLKNGRRKVEARNELNVFLGDDSDSFVSWLWDHLGKNLHHYVQPKDACPNEVAKPKPTFKEQSGGMDSQDLDSVPEREKQNKLSRSRHGKEWKGLVKVADESLPLRSIVTTNIHVEEVHKKVDQAKRSPSPRLVQKKRRRPDERVQTKKEEVSKSMVNAPRRLLQFAVRDAVGSPRTSSLSSEPSLKRLRSVVSTSTGDTSLAEYPQKVQSAARVPNASMAVAIKAVAEAAKDVAKVRASGNVFDRLGRDTDMPDTTHMAEIRDSPVEAFEECSDFEYLPAKARSTYLQQSDFSEQYARSNFVLESDTGVDSDVRDTELFEAGRILDHTAVHVPRTGTSAGRKDNDSLMMQYNVTSKADGSTHKLRKVQDQAAVINSSSKIASVNTWKPSPYQEVKKVSAVDNQNIVQQDTVVADKSGVQLMKENNNPASVGNGNAIPAADGPRESQKGLSSSIGLHSSGRPVEDADSRTIYVSNVHFAATKDSLSRHFNKFGEVLKVVIVTDAATGQPKGSAYVEFMRKEAAEHALSLDGTSFMSRLLKIVMKSTAPQEATPVMMWPRISRGSIFSASRFGRVPFPRGITSSYRARPPLKTGARSFQWKRDGQIATEATIISNNSVPSPTTPRSLTYVRAEPKENGNSGTI